ncbi:hypothetical protein E1176_11765 [Fulvivirga sp. RKSG066]|nr:hypothetical protein [Fulvivirga aurantia]
MLTKFKNVENEKIKKSFLKVMNAYQSLHDYEVVLIQKPIKSSTMQAQPIIDFKGLLKGVKRYKINLAEYVRDSNELKVADLPKDVLTGWFAHELGHLVDYEPFSNLQMIRYGLKYLISPKFRREAEHAADYIAIDHGFKNEILATKRFILEHDLLEEDYKAKIRKYYLSIEQVEMCTVDKTFMQPALDL